MKRIYTEIAEKYCSTPDEVEREILFAISVARKNPSPTAKAFWGGVNEDADVKDIIGHIVSRLALVV